MGRIQGDLLERTFELAVAILRLTRGLPNNTQGWEIGRQLIRSGTSVGANIREADHALTRAEFAHKCSIARKEASETHYWLQLCQRTELLSGQQMVEAIAEADELLRILSTIVKRTQEQSAEART